MAVARATGRLPRRRSRQAALRLPGEAVVVELGATGPAARARPHIDEAAQDGSGSGTSGGGPRAAPRRRYIVECTLDLYHRKAQIDDRQYAAGQLFRAAFTAAGKTPRVVSGYAPRLHGPQDGRHRGEAAALGDAALAAGRRTTRALAEVSAEDRDAVVAVCGLGDWAGLGGLARLRRGLDRLAAHFRLPRAGTEGGSGR